MMVGRFLLPISMIFRQRLGHKDQFLKDQGMVMDVLLSEEQSQSLQVAIRLPLLTLSKYCFQVTPFLSASMRLLGLLDSTSHIIM